MSRYSPNLNIMVRAAEKAGRSLVRDFGEVENLQVSKKGPGDFVSAADKRAEEIIFEELKKARPTYSFLMEESGAIAGEDDTHRWIVDPLDGTTNFLHGIPHWCVSIALESKGQIIAGVVYDPIKDDLFTAEMGQGAFAKRARLRVSNRDNMMETTIGTGAPRRAAEKRARFIREYQSMLVVAPGLRRFGAAALDLAYVAAGRLDGFWERDLKPWDVAAGILLVKESGGLTADIDKDNNNAVMSGNVMAANDKIFDDMKKVLRSIKDSDSKDS